MQEIMQTSSQSRVVPDYVPPRKFISWGILSGVAATLVMDFILIGALMAAGMPPFSCFSIIGDTMISMIPTLNLIGGVPLGVAAHYLIGPLLGMFFGILQRTFPISKMTSWKKAILFSVLYAEIISQPLLALPPFFLRMTASDTLLWFGGAFGMHFIWGCAFGAVWSLKVRIH